MKTSVTELPDSRVRVDVDVEPDDVDRGISRAARGLARDMRLPGFRKGKAPPSLIIQRVGREAVLQQALRDSLPEWYERALLSSGVNPVGDPSIEVTSVPDDEGEPLSFQFEVGVRPPAELGEYKGLEVGRPETDVPDDVLEQELERLRENFARLEAVERPAAKGDFVLVDFRGTVDGASVHPREVVKRALAHNAVAVILAHNHPSGVPEPSEADRSITRRLQGALNLIEIRVLDHLIVGGATVVSLAERGLV